MANIEKQAREAPITGVRVRASEQTNRTELNDPEQGGKKSETNRKHKKKYVALQSTDRKAAARLAERSVRRFGRGKMVRKSGEKFGEKAEEIERPRRAGTGPHHAELSHEVYSDTEKSPCEWRKWSCAKKRTSSRNILSFVALA